MDQENDLEEKRRKEQDRKRKFECDRCHVYFATMYNLSLHSESKACESNIEKQSYLFECIYCHLLFENKKKLLRHSNSAYCVTIAEKLPDTARKLIVSSYLCLLCNDMFIGVEFAMGHIQKVHNKKFEYPSEHLCYIAP